MNQRGPAPGGAKLIIVHWNRPCECAATIRSFTAQLTDVRILVLDNNSSSANYEALRQETDPSIEILRLEENKGWGPTLNVALEKWLVEETSRYCFISAHDAEAAPDCLTRLQAAMEADSELGIACPQYPDGSVPHLSPVHGVSYQLVTPALSGRVERIDVPHGTLIIVRRECLAEVGLFDERYFAYGDEHELGARARRYGWKVGLVWGAIAANPQTATPKFWQNYLFARNSLLLVRDYFGKWAALIRAVVILANIARFVIFPHKNGVAFSPRAQWQGCHDYFTGRFGPPPSR